MEASTRWGGFQISRFWCLQTSCQKRVVSSVVGSYLCHLRDNQGPWQKPILFWESLRGPTTQREVPHARHWDLLHSLSLLREALSGQMTLLHSNCVCIRTLIEPTYVLHTEQAYCLHWCQVKSDVKMMGWVVILLLIAFLTFPLMFVISEYTWIKITDNTQKYTVFIINNCGICGPPIDVFCPSPHFIWYCWKEAK